MRRLGLILLMAPLGLIACGDDGGAGGSGGEGGDGTTSSSKSTTTGSSMTTTGSTTSSTSSTTSSTSTGMSQCGNDMIDADEECDGTDLGGEDCASQGFLSGTLGCNNNCTFDTSDCVNAMCGNDVVEGMEICDGTDLGGQDCTDQGFDAGTLGCLANCSDYDTAGCVTFSCGDGAINGMEQCDGALLNNQTCATQGFDGGTLACAPGTCLFNTAGCLTEQCIDGLDNDSDGQVDCADVSCQAECADACATVPTIADPSTVTGNTTGHADDYTTTCADTSGPEVVYQVVASQTGFMHVTLTSDVDLGISAWTGCANVGTVINCEDLDFGAGGVETISFPVTSGQSVHLMVDGFSNGVVGPFTLQVQTIPAPVCGDGFAEGGEVCDDGNTTNFDGCNATCTSSCGDNTCAVGEDSCSCASDCVDDPNSCSTCQCGGPGGVGNLCYCDDICVTEGDCCANKVAVCGATNQPLQLTNNTITAITDNGYNGMLSTMQCVALPTAAGGNIVSVDNVVLTMAHTWIGDLTVKLVTPGGTAITLLNRPGSSAADTGADSPAGSGDDLVAGFPITFQTSAAVSAEAMGAAAGTQICAPLPTGDGICSYAPAADTATPGNFTNLVGQPVNGTWQLCVGDSAATDTGNIANVVLNFTISG